MRLEKIVNKTKEKFKGFKDIFYDTKRHEESLGIGAPTEYDIDRIKGNQNESYKRTQENN